MTTLTAAASRILNELACVDGNATFTPQSNNLPPRTRVYGSRQVRTIRALEDAGLVTVTENQCWDGSRSVHRRGFKTYTVSLVTA
jgi:hypothetical protein